MAPRPLCGSAKAVAIPAIVIHARGGAYAVRRFVGPDMEVHCGGFDTTGAQEPPVVYGDRVDEHHLGSVGGLIALDGGLAQVLVGEFVFVGEDGDLWPSCRVSGR